MSLNRFKKQAMGGGGRTPASRQDDMRFDPVCLGYRRVGSARGLQVVRGSGPLEGKWPLNPLILSKRLSSLLAPRLCSLRHRSAQGAMPLPIVSKV